jgi:hypothetical protein
MSHRLPVTPRLAWSQGELRTLAELLEPYLTSRQQFDSEFCSRLVHKFHKRSADEIARKALVIVRRVSPFPPSLPSTAEQVQTVPVKMFLSYRPPHREEDVLVRCKLNTTSTIHHPLHRLVLSLSERVIELRQLVESLPKTVHTGHLPFDPDDLVFKMDYVGGTRRAVIVDVDEIAENSVVYVDRAT